MKSDINLFDFLVEIGEINFEESLFGIIQN
jgi:hypothetical protein